MEDNFINDVCNSIKSAGINLILQLPCDRIAPLLYALTAKFSDIALTREEEGVGIAAGAALAGGKPLMVVQSSGIGNMVNALLSLTKFYELPLPIFVSQRGVYKENIAAQVPMGSKLPKILDAMGIEYKIYNEQSELADLLSELEQIYQENKIRCFLISPKVCEGLPRNQKPLQSSVEELQVSNSTEISEVQESIEDIKSPKSRIEIFEELRDFLHNKAVICNMGFPSRELYSVLDQPSNFYMLGSLGMVSSIGLGVSLFTKKDVVVLDGDGSLLMNPNALITIGALQPQNLTVICLDNGAYGSTGNQPTLTALGFKLENLARAVGISKIYVTDTPKNILNQVGPGPSFIKLVIKPGNAKVGTIGLSELEIKNRFSKWLSE